jgi:iron uptake system component EfeO
MRRTLVGLAVLGMFVTAGACAGSPGDSPAGAIEVEAKDHMFVPDELEAESGSLSFSIRNTGDAVHEFEIFEGKKLVDEVEDITPGLTRTLTVTLEPGTYEFACKFADHYERGMNGTLKVT